jgi:hypothetical protein
MDLWTFLKEIFAAYNVFQLSVVMGAAALVMYNVQPFMLPRPRSMLAC